MTPQALERRDRELTTFVETLTADFGRPERRTMARSERQEAMRLWNVAAAHDQGFKLAEKRLRALHMQSASSELQDEALTTASAEAHGNLFKHPGGIATYRPTLRTPAEPSVLL